MNTTFKGAAVRLAAAGTAVALVTGVSVATATSASAAVKSVTSTISVTAVSPATVGAPVVFNVASNLPKNEPVRYTMYPAVGPSVKGTATIGVNGAVSVPVAATSSGSVTFYHDTNTKNGYGYAYSGQATYTVPSAISLSVTGKRKAGTLSKKVPVFKNGKLVYFIGSVTPGNSGPIQVTLQFKKGSGAKWKVKKNETFYANTEGNYAIYLKNPRNFGTYRVTLQRTADYKNTASNFASQKFTVR